MFAYQAMLPRCTNFRKILHKSPFSCQAGEGNLMKKEMEKSKLSIEVAELYYQLNYSQQ